MMGRITAGESADRFGPHRPVRPIIGTAQGFTLLELIVVMFLVALVMGISAAFFANTLPGSAFNASVRDVASAMRLTRSLAQIHGASQTMTINLDTHSYSVAGRPEKTLPATVQIKVEDPLAGDVTTGNHEIVFPAMGGAEGGTIVLWNKTKTVRISADVVAGSVVVKSP